MLTVLFLLLCMVIFFYDILFRRVPNGLLLLALFVHIGYLITTGEGIGGINAWQSFTGGTIALIIFVPLYALRAMGGGDVKFLAVLGVLLGLKYLAIAWLIGSLFAGLHAIFVYRSETWVAAMPSILYRAMLQMTESNMYQRMLNHRQGREGIPYAAYLAIAAVFSLLMK